MSTLKRRTDTPKKKRFLAIVDKAAFEQKIKRVRKLRQELEVVRKKEKHILNEIMQIIGESPELRKDYDIIHEE
jgi:hypothetical protein